MISRSNKVLFSHTFVDIPICDICSNPNRDKTLANDNLEYEIFVAIEF